MIQLIRTIGWNRAKIEYASVLGTTFWSGWLQTNIYEYASWVYISYEVLLRDLRDVEIEGDS